MDVNVFTALLLCDRTGHAQLTDYSLIRELDNVYPFSNKCMHVYVQQIIVLLYVCVYTRPELSLILPAVISFLGLDLVNT